MGFITGIVKRLVKFLVYFTIFAAIVVLIPNLPPYTEFSSIKFESTQTHDVPLPNTALNNAKKLYLNKIHGPEAFRILNGELYTGIATGEVVKISPGGHVTFVTKIGKPCLGEWQEHICGRPLGLDIDEKNKQLYVVDSYYGIWKVDLKTDKKQLLVSPTVDIGKRVPKIFNSIVLSNNGDFYWTDSSSDFALKDGVYTMLADPTGRLYHYDAARNQSRVLVDGLWFANGVAMSPDNQYIVVAETAGYSLHRYYIDGPRKGQKDVFLQNLPGTPDNIQALPDGSGMLVGLYTMFDDKHPLLLKSMAPVPLVRKFLARMLKLIEAPFEFANTIYPHYFFEYATFMIGNFRSISKFSPPMSGLLHVDWNGKINGLFMNTDLTLQSVSDAIVFNDMLYIGSPHNQFIGAVPAPESLKKAFSPKKHVPVKAAETRTEKIPVKKADSSKPVEQKASNAKEESVKKDQQTDKKAHTKQPPKEAPKPQKPAEQVKPVQQPEIKTPKPSTPKPQETPTTQKPKEPEIKVSTTSAPPQASKSSPQAKDTKTKAESTTTSPDTKKTTPTQKSTSPPETKSKVKSDDSVEKSTEQQKVVSPEIKQKKIDPETKRAGKSKTNNKMKATLNENNNADTQNRDSKEIPDQIPIKEEILSDVSKPEAPKLKVITKEGPTEIPVPKI